MRSLMINEEVMSFTDLYEQAVDDFIADHYLDYDEEWYEYCCDNRISFKNQDYHSRYRSFMEDKRDEKFNK